MKQRNAYAIPAKMRKGAGYHTGTKRQTKEKEMQEQKQCITCGEETDKYVFIYGYSLPMCRNCQLQEAFNNNAPLKQDSSIEED